MSGLFPSSLITDTRLLSVSLSPGSLFLIAGMVLGMAYAVLLNRLPSVYSAREKSLETKRKVTAGKQAISGEEEEKRAQI